MKNTSPAKKIAGKRRWYFRHNKVTYNTVLKRISFYTHPWYYVGKPHTCNIVISRQNVKNVFAIPRETIARNPSGWLRLGILDLYIVYRWLNLGLIDFSRFNGIKMYALGNPVVKSPDLTEISDHHYLTLEQNPEYPERWDWHVRPRTYINSIPKPYHVACLPADYM